MTEASNFDVQLFLPYLLSQAAEVSSAEFQQVYKSRYGMLRTEWRVLFHLGGGGMTASQIGSLAKIHKTKVSRAVQRLAERRFLTRARDTGDRRVEHLKLTRSGRAALDDLLKVAERYDAALMRDMTPGETRVLRSALQKLITQTTPRFT